MMAEQDPRSPTDTGADTGRKGSSSATGGLMQAVSGISSSAGLLGLHMVSSTAVGLAMGWFLDKWLGTKPWLMIVFLGMGIVEGFRNMWREAQRMRRHEDAVQAAREAGEALPVAPEERKMVFFKKDHFIKTYTTPAQETAPEAKVTSEAASDAAPAREVVEITPLSGEKSDEVLDEEALRQALMRELDEAKADPVVAEALQALLRQAGQGSEVQATLHKTGKRESQAGTTPRPGSHKATPEDEA